MCLSGMCSFAWEYHHAPSCVIMCGIIIMHGSIIMSCTDGGGHGGGHSMLASIWRVHSYKGKPFFPLLLPLHSCMKSNELCCCLLRALRNGLWAGCHSVVCSQFSITYHMSWRQKGALLQTHAYTRTVTDTHPLLVACHAYAHLYTYYTQNTTQNTCVHATRRNRTCSPCHG